MYTIEQLNARCEYSLGFMCDENELRLIEQQFPKAPITLHLRNFNSATHITRVELHVPGLPDDRGPYAWQCDLNVLFPMFSEWLAKNKIGEMIRVFAFVEAGDEIATILNREIRILHQWGSGKQEEAEYKEYGPFKL